MLISGVFFVRGGVTCGRRRWRLRVVALLLGGGGGGGGGGWHARWASSLVATSLPCTAYATPPPPSSSPLNHFYQLLAPPLPLQCASYLACPGAAAQSGRFSLQFLFLRFNELASGAGVWCCRVLCDISLCVSRI